jgi:putative two-component system response regulator
MLTASEIYQGKILIVDDQDTNILLLERILRGAGYVSLASTKYSSEVVELHRKNCYDLILLDLQMPGMDGYEVMESLKEIELDGYLPVLVVTAQPSQKLHSLQTGAKDFISKPFELAEIVARVRNMIEVRLLHKKLQSNNDMLEQKVQERTTELHDSYLETIYTLVRAAERKDDEMGAHVKRISYYCREFAKIIGMDKVFVERVYLASPMHDIGKIGIPDHILFKPDGFTPDEWEIMKGHSLMGAKILGDSKSPYLQMGAEIALNHHERWDGSGYPNRKKGNDIPISARIMNICDVYDALRSKRSYKPAYNQLETMDIITKGDGRTLPQHFDPDILESFKRNSKLFQEIFQTYPSEI